MDEPGLHEEHVEALNSNLAAVCFLFLLLDELCGMLFRLRDLVWMQEFFIVLLLLAGFMIDGTLMYLLITNMKIIIFFAAAFIFMFNLTCRSLLIRD